MSEKRAGLFSGWWTALVQLRQVSGERREQVLGDLHEGSAPSVAYYCLLGISALITGFALILDSEVILIGASIAAPFMTPLIGMSLGLVRGEVGLLSRAMLALFIGVLSGVLLCLLLGRLPLMDAPTALLLSQTRLTLLDLLVASLAGFAGALAMIDERLSPLLPGVAIATGLNPPLAAIGLYLASEAYQGALAALLLFFANVLVILVVGAVAFFVAGFARRTEGWRRRGGVGRFSAAVISLAWVAIVLTGHPFKITTDISAVASTDIRPDPGLESRPVQATPSMNLLQQAEQIAREAFAERDHIHVDDVSLVELDSGPVLVIAIQSPRQPSAERVGNFQKFLRERLQNSDIRVDIRRISTSEMSGKGPVILGAAHYGALDERQRQIQAQIEDLLTRLIMDKPHFYVQAIDAAPAGTAWIVRGWVAGAHVLTPADIKALQGAVRQKLNQQVDLRILSRVELEVGEEGYQPPPIR